MLGVIARYRLLRTDSRRTRCRIGRGDAGNRDRSQRERYPRPKSCSSYRLVVVSMVVIDWQCHSPSSHASARVSKTGNRPCKYRRD